MRQIRHMLPLFLAAGMILADWTPAEAVPAKPTPISFRMADGTTVEVMRHGDENSNYITTLDGYLLVENTDGNLCFARMGGNGRLEATSVFASEPGKRDGATTALLQTIDRQELLDNLAAERLGNPIRKAARVAPEEELIVFPTKGSPRTLVLLVEFSDVSFSVDDPRRQFSDMLNKEGYSDWGASGSARDYYSFSSAGQFTPVFDVYGPLKVENTRAYYGGNNSYGNDMRPAQMIADACEVAANTTDIDFSNYDTDGDGVVDNIYVFYAGYGEADSDVSDAIWPHAWYLKDSAGLEIQYNGKYLNHYACSAELSGSSHIMNGIGTFVHEFTHVLGFMDLYATSYSAAFTPNTWSLMASGSYNNDQRTPPAMSVYERYCMGWVDPASLEVPENVTMRSIHDDGFNDCRLLPTSNPGEYYLFENRTKEGWDTYLPGEGMLVWHIDYDPSVWRQNILNNDASHQHVDIVEADNILSDNTRDGDTFPGAANVTGFSFETVPSLASWSGESLNASLSDICLTDGVVHFLFNEGVEVENVIELSAPEEEIGKTSFRIALNIKKDDTSSHIIDIYSINENEEKDYVAKGVPVTGESHFIDGLEPGMTYYCVLHYRNGYFVAHTAPLAVSTLEPSLDFLKVTLSEPSEISHDSFVANWNHLKDAEWYTIDLFTGHEVPDQSVKLDFSDKLNLPEGWTTTATNIYTGQDMPGAPALYMRKVNQELVSPIFDGDVTEVSFLCVGKDNVSDRNSLVLYGLTDGVWNELHSVLPLPYSAVSTVNVKNIPSGCRQIKLVFKRVSAGSVLVDDVCVKVPASGVYTPVETHTDINAGAVNSFKVEGLEPNTTYFYNLTAHNSEYVSKKSDYGKITTSDSIPTGVEEIGVDNADIEVFNTQGIRVTGSLAPGVYILRRGGVSKKIIVR